MRFENYNDFYFCCNLKTINCRYYDFHKIFIQYFYTYTCYSFKNILTLFEMNLGIRFLFCKSHLKYIRLFNVLENLIQDLTLFIFISV